MGRTALHIGAPPYAWADPLVAGLAQTPGVTLVRDTPPKLAEAVADGACTCALLPPLDAAGLLLSRVLPGIGVCTEGASGLLRVGLRDGITAPERLAAPEGLGGLTAPALAVLAAQHGAAPALEWVTDDALPVSCDGFVEAAPHFRDPLPTVVDVTAGWHQLTGLPCVHALWTGAHRAPYPRLRSLLAAAAQQGEAFDVRADHAPGVGYQLRSAEMDGLRRLFELSSGAGLCESDAGVALC